MMVAAEQEVLKSRLRYEDLVNVVERGIAEQRGIFDVEQDLWRGLLELGRQLLQEYVRRHGDGDVGPQVELPNGRVLRRLSGYRSKRYVSVFGELSIERVVYSKRESQKQELIPLDSRLLLPDTDFSLLLEHWCQAFCVNSSFGESKEAVRRILGLDVGVRAQEQMNRRVSRDVEEYGQGLPAPLEEEESEVVVIAADCKGIPMVRQAEDTRPQGKRLATGEKKNKKKMAAVAAVYSIDRHRRSSDDVLDEVRHRESEERRPVPQSKRVRADLTEVREGVEFNGKDATLGWASDQAQRRSNNGEKPVVCLMDGERALWSRVTQLLPSMVGVLDLFHVLERLWAAAYAFFGEGNDETTEFVEKQLRALLEGRVGYVIGSLKQMRTKRGLRGEKKKTVESVIGYFENNRKYMHYDEYLAEGFPIGSGVAEGTCRHLVKDRMERAGMRWTIDGAQAMLKLRAAYLNGEWDNILRFRAAKTAGQYIARRAITVSLTDARAKAA